MCKSIPPDQEPVTNERGQYSLQLGPSFGETYMLDAATPFSAAADVWLSTHRPYIRTSTAKCYVQYCNPLKQFFKSRPLGEFHIGHVRAYQQWRLQSAGPARANAEVNSALKPILREANLWRHIVDVYRPLPEPKRQVRRNMSEEEERRFLAVALDAGKPKRLLAGHCLVLMSNTGMGFGELRHLKREDVLIDQEPPFVTVNGGAKNDYRIRSIPLNWLALRSIRWILKRWESLGGREPDQYILPHHAKRSEDEQAAPGHKRRGPPDFSKPMGHIYRAARGILKEAGLEGFVPYDMRSHFGTKLLADPEVSDQMFKEIFGHANTRTRDRYSKQRIQKKAVAVERLSLEATPKVRLIAFPGGKK